MEREQYQVMFRREERHWWYAGMRRASLALLRSALPPDSTDLRILDAGCGTGGTTVRLRAFGRVIGVDLAEDAVTLAAQRGLRGRLTRGTIERLPFEDAAFDLVTSFEVVYHLGVRHDAQAFAELRRILRPGGYLLLRVPAHDWLRGAHDRLVHTRHRYDREEVRQKLESAGFEIERLSWANSLLFPPAVAKRLLERVRGDESELGHASEPDLWQPPDPVNAILESAVAVEALALPRGVQLPFGLSVIALARAT